VSRRDSLKAMALDAVQAQAEADLPRWLAFLTDDIVYRTIGTSAASGTWTGKRAIRDLEEMVGSVIDGGIAMTIDRVFVDDPVVIIEARGNSVTRVAREPYDNTYCLVLRFRGDLIEEWIEYLDTALVDRVIEIEESAQKEEHGHG